MNSYRLTVSNGLFFTRVALKERETVYVTMLLVDTGSNYTWETLASLRIDPATSKLRRSLMTANGLIQAPEVMVEELHCFGKILKQFPVVAHSIPLGATVGGVLGMNFLRQHTSSLNFRDSMIDV